jgi:hypothetical protein
VEALFITVCLIRWRVMSVRIKSIPPSEFRE